MGGALLALFGIVALFAPFVIGLSLAVVLGALLVVGGLVYVAAAFSVGGLLGLGWQVFLGRVYGMAGIAVLVNPLLGLTTLTLLVIDFRRLTLSPGFGPTAFALLGWCVRFDLVLVEPVHSRNRGLVAVRADQHGQNSPHEGHQQDQK